MRMANRTALRAIACIAALALLPIIPYAVYGYAGQDFESHVTAWLALRTAWLAGDLTPMWNPQANFGLGDVHLGLYPPGAIYAGGVLAMLMPLRYVPGFFVWIVTALSGAAMYFACREFVAQRDRLAAAILYMLSPYLVTTALVRFAAGELLVQMMLPLILLCFYRVVWQREWRSMWLLAGLLGISWFTNVPESVALFYTLLIVAAICGWMQRSVGPVLRMLAVEAVAGALAAFYLAPLWVERQWINVPRLARIDPQRLLLFMPYTGAGVEALKVFKYSCWLFACVNMLLLIACWWKRTQPFCDASAARMWSYLAMVAFFFQLPIAAVLWHHLPQIGLAQYPFRFQPVMGAAVPLLLLAAGTRVSLRWPAYFVIGAMTLVPLLEHARTQMTASTRMPRFAELERGWTTIGYEGMPEFVPLGVTRPAGPLGMPATTVVDAAAGSSCSVTAATAEADAVRFVALSSAPCSIRVAVYSYPYWNVIDQNGAMLPHTVDSDHMLVVQVPAGEHRVHALFQPRSAIRTISRTVSIAAWLVTLCFLLRAGTVSSRFRPTGA